MFYRSPVGHQNYLFQPAAMAARGSPDALSRSLDKEGRIRRGLTRPATLNSQRRRYDIQWDITHEGNPMRLSSRMPVSSVADLYDRTCGGRGALSAVTNRTPDYLSLIALDEVGDEVVDGIADDD
eukprot:1186685-Prorocentrum_minimum.AAC.3